MSNSDPCALIDSFFLEYRGFNVHIISKFHSPNFKVAISKSAVL